MRQRPPAGTAQHRHLANRPLFSGAREEHPQIVIAHLNPGAFNLVVKFPGSDPSMAGVIKKGEDHISNELLS